MIKNKIGYIMCRLFIYWGWLKMEAKYPIYEMYIDKNWLESGFWKA